jgi:hypothetical protein
MGKIREKYICLAAQLAARVFEGRRGKKYQVPSTGYRERKEGNKNICLATQLAARVLKNKTGKTV